MFLTVLSLVVTVVGTLLAYRRLRRHSDAPINLHWGWENRTVGLRVPDSTGAARRVENRVAGADSNPYLAIAASLVCGYIGMVDRMVAPWSIPGNRASSSVASPMRGA